MFFLMYKLICQKTAHFLSAQIAVQASLKCLWYSGCLNMEGRKQANGLKVKIRTYVHSRILQSFGGYSYSKNIRHKPIKLWFEYVCTLYILIKLSTCSSKMIHNGNLVISNNFKNQINWMGLESIFNLIIDIKNDFLK